MLKRFLLLLLAISTWNGVSAFDTVSGGGDGLLTQTSINNASKVLMTDLLLTTNTAVIDELVTITIPGGTGALEFSTDPVALVATSGNFTVNNLNQSATQIDFEITGSGTLSVQNIGLYGTNFALPFAESRFLNVNFQSSNKSADFFPIDTRDFAVGFGGGVLLNNLNSSSASALPLETLNLVANTVLTDETVTIAFDPGTTFTTPGVGSISVASSGNTLATTTMASLDDFADGNVIGATTANGTTEFLVTASNTVTDFVTFLNTLNLSATFDDTNDEINLLTNEDYLFSSNGVMPDVAPDFIEAANLQFGLGIPNFVVSNGALTIDNLSLTTDQLQFDLSGMGTLELQGLQVYADNLAAKGEFFETRSLNVNAQGADLLADTMVVDTINYGARVDASGATGTDDIFIVGDTLDLTFAPDDFSTRFSAATIDFLGLGGEVLADFDTALSITSGTIDGDIALPLSVTYAGTNISANYIIPPITVDNQLPTFDFTGFNMLTLPAGKTVGGINDIVSLNLPPEASGDVIVFTADFSNVGGSVANFIQVPAADAQIVLQEVALDTATFSVPITFEDDAGNVLPTLVTNQIAVDLIRPVLSTANILSIIGNPVPGVIGDTVEVQLPIDTAGSVGDTVTYDIDLSAAGNASTNFVGANTAQNFVINAGSLDDVAFNQTLTVYDKALNSVSATTNSLQIDNRVANFDTSCGANFQVIDNGLGDDNNVADVSNIEPDSVFFRFPNKTLPGCEVDRFSINLRSLTGTNIGSLLTEVDADGTGEIFILREGFLDDDDLQFPITIFDANGNNADYLTGPLNIDNRLTQPEQITDLSTILTNKTPNGVILKDGEINILTIIGEADVVAVTADIDGAADSVVLQRNSVGRWVGSLTIRSGSLTVAPRFIRYTITDNAGNLTVLEGDKVFYITNNTTVRRGGGGGSLNTGNISKKSTLQRFTPNQSKAFHDLNSAQKLKTKEQLRIESLRRRLAFQSGPVSRIQNNPEVLIQQRRQAWRARQEAIARDGTPKALQTKLEKLVLPRTSPKALAAARDDEGEFRLRSTLDNLKSANTTRSQLGSFRRVAPGHRGKWLDIKR